MIIARRPCHTTPLSTKRSMMPSFPVEPPRWRKLPKDLAMRFAGRIGAASNAVMGPRAGGAMGILTYHRVSNHTPGLPAPLHNVTPNRFREQIGGLLDRGFQFWPLSKAIEHHLTGLSVPPRTVVLTFDDGFATVYTEAYPLLGDLGVPASVFVNTAYLDSDAPCQSMRGAAPIRTGCRRTRIVL